MLFREQLYEVQRVALSKAHLKTGFAYFLEMGLGKTRLTYHEQYELASKDLIDVGVILCPKSLRATWADEAEEIGFPYPVIPFDGTFEQMRDKIAAARKESSFVMVIIHYDIVLTKGGDLIEHLLNSGTRIYIALDESTRIKNPKAKVGRYLHTIKDKFAFRRILTGAPNPQGPHDLWGQLFFIGAVTQNYYQFRSTYCKMGGYMMKKIVGAQNIDILEQRTGDFVFRAKKGKKRDGGWTDDLPEKLPAVIRQIDMTPRQKHAYKTMLQDFVTEWGDVEITAKMAVTAKNKLQQIGSGFMYDNEGNVVYLFGPGERNPKIEDLIDAIDERETSCIVFYNFKPTRAMLEHRFAEREINFITIPSGLNDEEAAALKKQFNTAQIKTVALCQVAAVKYGWTLIGDQDVMPCHSVLFYENSYDYEARVQGEDRPHRHGQRYPVDYTDFAISPEDRNVIKALQRKSGLTESVLAEFTYRSR